MKSRRSRNRRRRRLSLLPLLSGWRAREFLRDFKAAGAPPPPSEAADDGATDEPPAAAAAAALAPAAATEAAPEAVAPSPDQRTCIAASSSCSYGRRKACRDFLLERDLFQEQFKPERKPWNKWERLHGEPREGC